MNFQQIGESVEASDVPVKWDIVDGPGEQDVKSVFVGFVSDVGVTTVVVLLDGVGASRIVVINNRHELS